MLLQYVFLRMLSLMFVAVVLVACASGGCGTGAMDATLSYGNLAAKADAVAITGYFDCGFGSNAAVEAQASAAVRCSPTRIQRWADAYVHLPFAFESWDDLKLLP